MPSPSTSLATLRPDLAESLEQFDLEMDRRGYIALQVCTKTDVQQQAGTYGIIPVSQLLQNPDTARSPGSGYKRGNFTFTKATYATSEHGWEEPIDDKEVKMYANYFDAELYATARAQHFVCQSLEKRVGDMLFNTSNFDASHQQAAAIAWTMALKATMTPVDDVEAAVIKVANNSGVWPNSLILTKRKFRILRHSAQIVDRLKYNGIVDVQVGKITRAQLALAFDLENVFVAGGTLNSANEGQAVSLGSLWSDNYAMVAHINPTEDFKEPTLCRTFHWGDDGSQIGGTIETYRDEKIRGDVVRCRNETDERIVYTDLGCLVTGI